MMKFWLDNELKPGNRAAPNFRVVGLDYPYGQSIEHLYCGGPIIAGIVNGVRRVSPTYWEGVQKWAPSVKEGAREKLWQTAATLDTTPDPNVVGYHKTFMGRKGYDDDPTRGEVGWNLLSSSNRALASGVYVFSVESDYGREIGKFVLIR